MIRNKRTNLLGIIVAALSLITSMESNAWYGDRGHYHGQGRGYFHGGDYGRYPGPWNWGGPNVIIAVPPTQYYAQPYCETVRICNPYHECWLERHCD